MFPKPCEQSQGYRISFELTKPSQSNQALLVPWCLLINFTTQA